MPSIGEQDMRYMGGLRPHIPVTFWMMIIGTLAITGVGIPFTPIGFAGFFSKDVIIEATYRIAFAGLAALPSSLLVIAALFTSFYSWRLIFMTFHGKPRASHEVCTTCTSRRRSCWCRSICWRSAQCLPA